MEQSHKPWYDLPRKEIGGELAIIIDGYKTSQSGRRAAYIRNLELYEGRVLGGYSAHGYMSEQATLLTDRLGLIRSAVSSAVASIYAPQKPKPQFQTLGATWATRRKAYKLDRVCEGILNQRQGRWINVWSAMIDLAVDAALQGVGCMKVVANRAKKRIEHEWVALPDLFVDPAEGRNPQCLYQRSPIDREQARLRYPKLRKAIDDAGEYEWYGSSHVGMPRTNDVIELKQAWRLPQSSDEPGMTATVIGGEAADIAEWTAPAFPFIFLLWEPWRDGFWASGLADEGSRQAEECADLDARLFSRELIASGKKIYYHEGTVNPESLMLNDAVVGVPVQQGQQFPQESLATPFAPMELQYLQDKVRNFWDSIGISQVSAAARREQGVQSGVAMMTLNDTKAGRQLVKSQRYEQAFVDLADQYVWRLRELADEDADFMITWPGKTLMRQVKWADADTEDDEFSVTVAPSSSLPHDPAGRQEMVQTLYNSGLISQETAKGLIGWPDLDSELNVENAEYEYVDQLIERYLDADQEDWDDGDYEAPEGFILNKMQALRRFSSAWFRARIDQRMLKSEEEKAKAEFSIKLLVRWIKELDKLMNPAPPAPPPGAAVPPVPPGLPSMLPADQNAPMDQLPMPPVAA